MGRALQVVAICREKCAGNPVKLDAAVRASIEEDPQTTLPTERDQVSASLQIDPLARAFGHVRQQFDLCGRQPVV